MASSPRRTNQTEKPPTASAPKPGAKARAVPGGPLIKTSSGKKNPALSAAAQSALLIEKLQEQQILLQLQNEQLQEANAELEISCHRLHDLYDLAPVGFMTFDEKGCVREINHTAAELFGYSVTFLSDKPISSYLLQPDRKLFLHHLWQCRQEQKELIITLRLSSKDGCERLLEFTTQPAPDLASRPGWCRSALVDVSQKRATELALSESESKFRQLAENIDEVFWFIALDPSRATYVSPAFEHIWGVSAAELYADFSVWERSVHPDDLLAVQAAFRAWISGEASSHRSEYRILHPSGQIRWNCD
jgi:PAS domain S-box-containing protein